jgi:hypothetical protein
VLLGACMIGVLIAILDSESAAPQLNPGAVNVPQWNNAPVIKFDAPEPRPDGEKPIAAAPRPARVGDPVWTLDRAKIAIPDRPASGHLLGANFEVENARLDPPGTLTLKHGSNSLVIFLSLKPGQAIAGKSYEFGPERDFDLSRPSVHVHIHEPFVKLGAYGDGYLMKLEFGKEVNQSVASRVYLALPDEAKSVIAGTFTLPLN